MKVVYSIDMNDFKDVCFEAAKILPNFKKRKLILSTTFPLITLFFLVFPFVDFQILFFVIPLTFIYYYFYGFAQDFLFLPLKRAKYKYLEKSSLVTTILKENLLIAEELGITREIRPETIVSHVEKEDKHIFFLSNKSLDFIIVKKIPMELSQDDLSIFDTQVRKFLSNL